MVWLGGFLSSLNKTAVNKGFPVFVAPVRDGFGASNAAVGFIFSLARAQSGPSGPLAGWFIDRFGPRWALFVGALMSGGGFLALGYTTSLWAFGVVYLLAAGRHRGFSTGVLLLAGVTLNSFLSALILLVQYFADMTQTMQTLRWLLGDLDVAGYRPLVAALPMLAIAYVVFLVLAPSLNLLSLGSDLAAARGVDVLRVERVAFLTASLATGAAVSIAGPIGFIGIVVPHLVRMVVGPDHRLVVPASLGFGAAFLIGCDLISRTVLAPIDLPVGIVTALIGGPFFLWLLVRQS